MPRCGLHPVPGRAKAAADKYDVPHAYDTLEELLADDTVDAVTIGSPIGVHYDQGVTYPVDADDNSLLLLDFGGSLFAFVYGTPAGCLTDFGQPTFYGTKGSIAGLMHDGTPLEWPGKNPPGNHFNGPHVVGPHDRDESHVYEDMMQLVDWVNDGTPSVATAEHARHVIEIIEAGFRAAETGQVQSLTTTF